MVDAFVVSLVREVAHNNVMSYRSCARHRGMLVSIHGLLVVYEVRYLLSISMRRSNNRDSLGRHLMGLINIDGYCDYLIYRTLPSQIYAKQHTKHMF